jgi:outer membrane protein assembly factor BamB
MSRIRRAAAVGVTAVALVLPVAAPASADGHVSVVAEGLAGPLQVEVAPNGTIYVAEAFGSQVTAIDKKGRRSVLWSGAPGTFSPGIGVQGGQVYVTASTEPDEQNPAGRADLLRISQGGQVTRVVDLMAFELAVNPDQQAQFDPESGEPYDALANPYDVLALPGRTLVADAGANAIISVAANGRPSVFTVLPVSYEGECAELPNNTADGFGCDSVPTGIALGPDGYLYVSGLGGGVEGHVWKLDPRTGAIVQSWSGLPPLTGIAVAPDGTLYVSSGFTDEVLRVDTATGDVTGSVQLPTPTGLTWADGALYVTSGFTGQLFRVLPSAFA